MIVDNSVVVVERKEKGSGKVFYRVTAHDWETDHPRVVFIDPNDLS